MDANARIDKLEQRLDEYIREHRDNPEAHSVAFEARGFVSLTKLRRVASRTERRRGKR